MQETTLSISTRSLAGLNAANFFQAEMVGVLLPVLNALLREAHWRYDSIGFATAAAGLGTLLFQAPAGWLTDKLDWRRGLFAVAALLTGACFVSLPVVLDAHRDAHLWVDTLLFLSGATQSLFVPVLAALALALAGHERMNCTMGANQGWNHAGNIVAALLAMLLVSLLGLTSVFYSVGVFSLLAGASVMLILKQDLDERRATGLTEDSQNGQNWRYLFTDRNILFLFISIFLFHLANAPILPTVALYVKKLGGSDNWMTATVLTAQVVMVPVSLLTGRFCDSWGNKPVMAIAFWVLPVRILSYTLVSRASAVVYLQALDGIGAGIYGVAVAAFSADLTRGKGGFNTLMGFFATALAIGGVAGPIFSGLLVQYFGFRFAFIAFAMLAAFGAFVFSFCVQDTRQLEKDPLDPSMSRAAVSR
jgi:MFS family permease